MKENVLYKWEKNRNIVVTILLTCICCISPILWLLLPVILNSAKEFTITDRRIYIKRVNGNCTELPTDSICTIHKTFWFSKLVIKTPSGSIGVWGFSERDKAFDIISDILISRQDTN